MTRSMLLASVIAGCAVALFSGCKSESPRHIVTSEAMPREFLMRFSVIGDRTGDAVPGIYAQIIGQVQNMNPDFVWTVGDMIEGRIGDTILVKQEWEEYLALIEPLTMPVYFTPGNHDIWDSTSLGLYRRYIGEPYFSFNVRDVHFICLDNSRWHRIDLFPEEQIDWLIDDLENNVDARYIFVFMHVPYWVQTIARGEPDTLHNLFVKYGVDASFGGHFHRYYEGRYDGVTYVAVGSSGARCLPGPRGLHYHSIWVTVERDSISVVPLKMDFVLPWEEAAAGRFAFLGPEKLPG